MQQDSLGIVYWATGKRNIEIRGWRSSCVPSDQRFWFRALWVMSIDAILIVLKTKQRALFPGGSLGASFGNDVNDISFMISSQRPAKQQY